MRFKVLMIFNKNRAEITHLLGTILRDSMVHIQNIYKNVPQKAPNEDACVQHHSSLPTSVLNEL